MNSKDWDFSPGIAPDGLSIYLERKEPSVSGSSDLWLATRADLSQSFSNPVLVPALNTVGADERNPTFSPDGLELFFDRVAVGLMRAVRKGKADPFTDPKPVSWVGAKQGWNGCLGPDGLTLYFQVDYDLAVATRQPGGTEFTYYRMLDELNTFASEGWPTVSSDNLEIFFERDSRIWVARRAAPPQKFGNPELEPTLNLDSFKSGDPELSRDGHTIYFSSDRPPTLGHSDIWFATRSCLQ